MEEKDNKVAIEEWQFNLLLQEIVRIAHAVEELNRNLKVE